MNEFIGLGAFLTYLLILLALFLIFRMLVLWYYKIDKRVDLQIEQNRLLREIKEELKSTKT